MDNKNKKTVPKKRPISGFSELLEEHSDGRSGFTGRRKRIQELEKILDSKIITYIQNLEEEGIYIDTDDVTILTGILTQFERAKTIDLIIHSYGGEALAAQRIVYAFREYAKNFRVIVPNIAKSAATIVAFGAEKILINSTAELGPIDPQFKYKGHYIPKKILPEKTEELIKKIEDKIGKGHDATAYIQQLAMIDPSVTESCKRAVEDAELVATELLLSGMLKKEKDKKRKAKETVDFFLKAPKTHGRRVTASEIHKRKDIHLKYEIISKKSPAWGPLSELMSLYEVCFHTPGENIGNIFETADFSFSTRFV